MARLADGLLQQSVGRRALQHGARRNSGWCRWGLKIEGGSSLRSRNASRKPGSRACGSRGRCAPAASGVLVRQARWGLGRDQRSAYRRTSVRWRRLERSSKRPAASAGAPPPSQGR